MYATAASSTQSHETDDGHSGIQMPLPPMQYIKNYSDDALKRGSAPLPPPPITDSYLMFGHPFSTEDCIVPSLESQGIRRLYSAKEIDRPRELRKLNHSILVNFLDLIDILIKSPDSAKREEKIDDLSLLLIHMHHLINEFRPIHARELLHVMLYTQKRRRLQVAKKFRDNLDKVQDMIQEALDNLPDDNTFDSQSSESYVQNKDLKPANKNESSCKPADAALSQLADEILAADKE